MENYIKQTVKDQLKKYDLVNLLNEDIVSYKSKEDFQFVIDLVDIETGDVFSFMGTEGHTEFQALSLEALNAYKENLNMSIDQNNNLANQ